MIVGKYKQLFRKKQIDWESLVAKEWCTKHPLSWCTYCCDVNVDSPDWPGFIGMHYLSPTRAVDATCGLNLSSAPRITILRRDIYELLRPYIAGWHTFNVRDRYGNPVATHVLVHTRERVIYRRGGAHDLWQCAMCGTTHATSGSKYVPPHVLAADASDRPVLISTSNKIIVEESISCRLGLERVRGLTLVDVLSVDKPIIDPFPIVQPADYFNDYRRRVTPEVE